MEYRFWKLKTNPVRIVKYQFGFIDINLILFRQSIYTIFELISRAKKNVALLPKLVQIILIKRGNKLNPKKFPFLNSKLQNSKL